MANTDEKVSTITKGVKPESSAVTIQKVKNILIGF